jgi:hypothetical protein
LWLFKPSALTDAPEVSPEVRLLKALTTEMSREELQSALKMKDNDHFRKAYLLPMLEKGLIEMTIPEKPRNIRKFLDVVD